MAKSHTGGPGSHTRGSVNGTMDAPFKSGSNKGSQNNMGGAFDAPRTGGDNGLPTRAYDKMGGPKAGPKANGVSSLGTIRTSPHQPRRG